jgi:hypothetical protein
MSSCSRVLRHFGSRWIPQVVVGRGRIRGIEKKRVLPRRSGANAQVACAGAERCVFQLPCVYVCVQGDRTRVSNGFKHVISWRPRVLPWCCGSWCGLGLRAPPEVVTLVLFLPFLRSRPLTPSPKQTGLCYSTAISGHAMETSSMLDLFKLHHYCRLFSPMQGLCAVSWSRESHQNGCLSWRSTIALSRSMARHLRIALACISMAGWLAAAA